MRVLVVLAALLLAGCTTTTPPAQPALPTPGAVETPAPPPPPEPSLEPEPEPAPEPPPTSPLTGAPEDEPLAVLTVKLDNTPNAQPHAGLTDADVVYLQEVEYGITRLVAVFSSTVPTRIGPVRSARITDLDLLRQYGSPAFAFSGAQRKLWPAIYASPLINISPNKTAASYSRDRARRAPYNYFLNGEAGLANAPDASVSKDIGFVFDEAMPSGGQPISRASVRWGGSSASFDYKPKHGHFAVTMNGRRAEAEEHRRGQNAATVVIQYVKQARSAYNDKAGGNTPKAETIGSGTALILRDGHIWEATWERKRPKGPTRFRGADGAPIPFKPGQQWVVLMDDQRPATIEFARPETETRIIGPL